MTTIPLIRKEFNDVNHFHGETLLQCGGVPDIYSPLITFGSRSLCSHYGFRDMNSIYQTAIISVNNGKITIQSPFGLTLNDATPFDIYLHFGCNNDPNLAKNWKNDPRFGIIHPIPSIDIHQTDNTPELKELSLVNSIVKPNSFTARFTDYISRLADIPTGTCLINGLSIFSAATSTRYNCSYEDGQTTAIPIYSIPIQSSGAGKTRVQGILYAPLRKMLLKRCSDIEKAIEVLKEQEDELSLDSANNKARLLKLNRAIKKLSKKLNFASNLSPITSATPESLDNVLKQTGGIAIAISSEQALSNSLLCSSGKKANTDVLYAGREGGYIRTNRVGRVGYSGYCSMTICCFAQESLVQKMIETSNDTGLFERFITIVEPDRVGERNHLNVIPPDKELLEIYERKFDFFEKVLDEGFHPDRLITLHIAHSDWLNIHHLENEFEVQLKSGGKYAHPIMRRFISKLRMHIISISCNLFLLEEEAPDRSCYVPSEYVLSAIYMMRQLIEGLHTYCISRGIISNDEQNRTVFDLFVKHKDGLKMHEIKKKAEGLRAFKDLPDARKTIEEVVRYLAMNNVLLWTNGSSYIKNPNA